MSERTKLTLLKKADHPKIHNLIGKEITLWINPIPYPPKKQDIYNWLNQMSKKSNKTFTIRKKINNVIIGMIWIEDITKSQAEIGFWLGKKYQGKGYMKEAGKLITKHARKLKIKKLKAITVGKNISSQKTLEKLGFSLKKVFKKDFKNQLKEWCDVLIYEQRLAKTL